MIQRREGLRFAHQAVTSGCIARQFRGQDLDRDAAAKQAVARLVHLSHATGAERADDVIGTEAIARAQSAAER